MTQLQNAAKVALIPVDSLKSMQYRNFVSKVVNMDQVVKGKVLGPFSFGSMEQFS